MSELERGAQVHIKGMAYGPTNEQGVVFLFGRLAPRLGFVVEVVQSGFPDCIARRRGKEVRIEFEYRASNYKGHPPRGADAIVCWENDWSHPPHKYRHLEIIELKSHVGALPRVYAVSAEENRWRETLDKEVRLRWSVPRSVGIGDLVLIYRTAPASAIRDLYKVVGPFYEHRRWGYLAWLKRIVHLKKCVTWKELCRDRTTRDLPVVTKRFQGKAEITADWPLLYALIVKNNPAAKKALQPWAPD